MTGIHLAHTVFSNLDNFSKALQSDTLTALEGHHLANQVVDVVSSLRDDEKFDLFWEKVERIRVALGKIICSKYC